MEDDTGDRTPGSSEKPTASGVELGEQGTGADRATNEPSPLRFLPIFVVVLVVIAGTILFVVAFSSQNASYPAPDTAEPSVNRGAEAEHQCRTLARALRRAAGLDTAHGGPGSDPPTLETTAMSLVGLASAHGGCGTDQEWVDAAFERLQQADGTGDIDPLRVKTAAWILLAISLQEDPDHPNLRAWMDAARSAILDAQRSDGGFADGGAQTDGYQTLMAVWALLRAEQVDQQTPSAVVASRKRGVEWVRREMEQGLFQNQGKLVVSAGLPALGLLVLHQAWQLGDRRPDDPALFAAGIRRMGTDCGLNRDSDPMVCQRSWNHADAIGSSPGPDQSAGRVRWLPWTILAGHRLAEDLDLPLGEGTRRLATAIWQSGLDQLFQHAAEIEQERTSVLSVWAFVLGRLSSD